MSWQEYLEGKRQSYRGTQWRTFLDVLPTEVFAYTEITEIKAIFFFKKKKVPKMEALNSLLTHNKIGQISFWGCLVDYELSKV